MHAGRESPVVGGGRVEHGAGRRQLESHAARSSRERRHARALPPGVERVPSRIAARSVVLPEPFGPTRPTFSPRSTTIVASSSSCLSPAESAMSSASTTIRPVRGGSMKSKPSVRWRFVSDSISWRAAVALLLEPRDLRELRLRLLRLRPSCIGTARRSARAARCRRDTRPAVLPAAAARAAFSCRHSCHGPAK